MWRKLYKTFRSSFGVISVITMIVLWSAISYYAISYAVGSSSTTESDSPTDIQKAEVSSDSCNVYGINIHGEIVTYNGRDAYNDQGKIMFDQASADEIVWYMAEAQRKDDIKAVIIEIDSSGGSGEAGEEIMRAFKESSKPVVAYIRNRGLSAAYLAATGAETIFASKFSDVGSIGVTGSYLQETEKNKKDGLTYIDLSSGKFKDTGNPNRPLSEDEKKLLMRDVKIGFEYFVNLVAENRNLDVAKVKKLADGSTVMGEQALEDGLIDKIGLFTDVERYVREKIGVPVAICWQN